MSSSRKRQPSTKRTDWQIWWSDGGHWVVTVGRLVPPPGRPRKVRSLFRQVAEKIPFGALDTVRDFFREEGWSTGGVYVAHDSMGFARYVGRGHVFDRLKARYRRERHALKYFSFYILENKNHESEIETMMIRLGGAHLHFNSRKKRVDIQSGNVRDFEAGTGFIERRAGRKNRRTAVD